MIQLQELQGALVTPLDVICKVRGEALKLAECIQRAERASQCFNCFMQMLLSGTKDDTKKPH